MYLSLSLWLLSLWLWLLSKVKVKSTPSLRPKTWSLTKTAVWFPSALEPNNIFSWNIFVSTFILYISDQRSYNPQIRVFDIIIFSNLIENLEQKIIFGKHVFAQNYCALEPNIIFRSNIFCWNFFFILIFQTKDHK